MNCDYFKLTCLEFAIMRVLWSTQRLMSAENIAERLTGHSRATVAELLRRLAAKAAVQSMTIDRKAMYFYTVNEPMYKAMLLKDLAETLFGGDRAELVHLLLCDMDITPGELGEVKAAVERAEEVAELIARAEARHEELVPANEELVPANEDDEAEAHPDAAGSEALEYSANAVIDLASYRKERKRAFSNINRKLAADSKTRYAARAPCRLGFFCGALSPAML